MSPDLERQLTRELKFHARGLGIPDGAAEVFIEKTITSLKKTFRSKSIITEDDLIRETAKELKKYSADLAYVYKNYDKII